MKKYCPKYIICNGYRKKKPWCKDCALYTHDIYDPIFGKINEPTTDLKT